MRSATLTAVLAALTVFSAAMAGAIDRPAYMSIRDEYPADKFIVGIGEAEKSSNSLKDERVSEILARIDVAKHVQLILMEFSMSEVCEREPGKLFRDNAECQREFKGAIDSAMDKLKENSTIIKRGQQGKDMVYAVAVMPRLKAQHDINEKLNESVRTLQENLKLASGGDRRFFWKAREDYVNAIVLNKEKELIVGKGSYDRDFFRKIESSLLTVREK